MVEELLHPDRIFRSDRTGNVYVMNADGTSVQQLTNSAQEDRAASWSPDGLTIAFHKEVPGNTDMWLMNADGTNQRNLTSSPLSFNSEASWVSDVSAFYSAAAPAGNAGTLALYRVDAGTGSLTQVTTETAGLQDTNPVLSPDESTLLFTSNRAGGAVEVFSLDLGTLAVLQVTNAPGFSASHDWR